MEYLTVYDIANWLDLSHHTIQKYVQQKKLPGRKLGRTWITTDRELKEYIEGKPVEEIQLTELYDVRSAAEYFGVDVNVVRRMIKAGRLEGTHIDDRGRFRGTLAFTLSQVLAANPYVPQFLDSRPGRRVRDDIDDHIEAVARGNTVYHAILGTHDKNHSEYAYKNLSQARERAREAFKAPLRYKKHDIVRIRLDKHAEGNQFHKAAFTHDVTPICKTAVVKILEPETDYDGEEVLIDVDKNVMGL